MHGKVLAIQAFPVPSMKWELLRFMGKAHCYCGFCANFASVVVPLTDLLKADIKYVSSPVCQHTFDEVKSLLSTALVLMAPRLDLPFQMQINASDVGAGAVLLQADRKGLERPVSYLAKGYQKHYFVIVK